MRGSEIEIATSALLRAKYNLFCGLFIFFGIVVELLAIVSSSVLICLVPFILFGVLGALVRCPLCQTPLGYFHEHIFPSDASDRCRGCCRIITSKPDRRSLSA
jgi:hypothetical protein